MASSQIPQVPFSGRSFPRGFSDAGLRLVYGDSWVEWQAVRENPLRGNVPTEKLRGQLANNDSAGEVCFLWRSHLFMRATHYKNLCHPLGTTRVSVCVLYPPKKTLFLSCSDPGLSELERMQLGFRLRLSKADREFFVFCLASEKGRRKGFNWTTSVTFCSFTLAFPGL